MKKENDVSLPSIPWGQYPWGEYTLHTITEEEALKPYMITYNAYEDLVSFDVILLINGIGDSMSLRAGQRIRLPDLDELRAWLDAYK